MSHETKHHQINHPSNQTHWDEIVREYVDSMRFGTVAVLVQDQHVIEIEKTERHRIANSTAPNRK